MVLIDGMLYKTIVIAHTYNMGHRVCDQKKLDLKTTLIVSSTLYSGTFGRCQSLDNVEIIFAEGWQDGPNSYLIERQLAFLANNVEPED